MMNNVVIQNIAGISGKERLPISKLILKIRSKIQIWLYKRGK